MATLKEIGHDECDGAIWLRKYENLFLSLEIYINDLKNSLTNLHLVLIQFEARLLAHICHLGCCERTSRLEGPVDFS